MNNESMTDNDIFVKGAQSMSEMLKTNTTLTSLNLECDEKGRKIKRNREMKNDLQIMLLEMKEQNQ